ncbi:MAG: hypothetical protein KKE64_04855, partial [Candidatus Omnitrophica bacterium]|nr:hypothetical protein [Candidatus Omnitrophota bacterium]
LQWLWAVSFDVTSVKSLRWIVNGIKFVVNSLNTKGFSRYLIRENPDFIISTHFLPPYIASQLKINKRIKSSLITVITDFGVHPFWLTRKSDIYCVASEYTKKVLIREWAVDQRQIKVSGIPIDRKFKKKLSRQELASKLEINHREFTVLVVTGSFGIGPIEETVDLLDNQVQVLAVCANNKKLYQRLKNKGYSTVKVFGFVNNIEELMSVSDLIVTKPGGLSISELLVKQLAPVFVSPIPGQETANIKAMDYFGIGLIADSPLAVKSMVLDYRNNPLKLCAQKEKIFLVAKPDAAEEIYKLCMQE